MNGFIKMKQVRKINHLLVDCNCCGIGRYDLRDQDIIWRDFVISRDEETGVSSLSFTEATEDDNGDYICKIITDLGSDESTFTLQVVEPGNCVYLTICMYGYACVCVYLL